MATSKATTTRRKKRADRKRAVLRLYAAGLSHHDIADQLGMRLDHVVGFIRERLDQLLNDMSRTSQRYMLATHVLQQQEQLRRLCETEDKLIDADGTRYAHTIVASIKARTDIQNGLLETLVKHGLAPDPNCTRPKGIVS